MEVLEDKVKGFLSIDIPSGYGLGQGWGSGSGGSYSDGYGYGLGSGHSLNTTLGLYNIFFRSDCCGSSDCCDSGDHYDSSNGSGRGFDDGNGRGSYDGSGSGQGNGCVDGIKTFNNNKVYSVDNIPTIFISVHGNVAKGYIIRSDLQLKPCFIVKGNNKFAHGDTLRDAFTSLQEKLYNDSTEDERIEAFIKKFPNYEEKYDNRDFFIYHHVLTGSCRMGRETFMADRGLSLDGKTSVRDFVELTKNAYGCEIIRMLPAVYGIK